MLIYRALSAVAAAALGAALMMALPGFSPAVEAGTPVTSTSALSVTTIKTDRTADRPLVGECAEQAWPYYGAGCLRDRSQASGQARAVRLVTTDRLPK
jgi:hypothetical protein